MERLPDELLINIFSRLPLIQIQQIRKVRMRTEYFFLNFLKRFHADWKESQRKYYSKYLKLRMTGTGIRMYYETVHFLSVER